MLQKALNTMHSVQKNPAGIEQHLENCERVLHLLLQVQIAELNSHRLEKEEDECSVQLSAKHCGVAHGAAILETCVCVGIKCVVF